LTDLESHTYYGRPNFNDVLSKLKRAIESDRYLPGSERNLVTNVGVYYCGTALLAKNLKTKRGNLGYNCSFF
jgi:hypothetical protein